MAKRKSKHDGIRVRGFFRVNLVEHDQDDGTPRIVGDSGWQENVVVTAGKAMYLALALASQAGSKYVSRAVLGTGGVPATGDTMIAGSIGDNGAGASNRPQAVVTTGQSGGNVSVQFAFTWASSNSFNTIARTIQNIGLLQTETTGGTIFAGNTYTTSQLSSNQDVGKFPLESDSYMGMAA